MQFQEYLGEKNQIFLHKSFCFLVAAEMFLEVALFLETSPVLKNSWVHAWLTTMTGWQIKLLESQSFNDFILSNLFILSKFIYIHMAPIISIHKFISIQTQMYLFICYQSENKQYTRQEHSQEKIFINSQCAQKGHTYLKSMKQLLAFLKKKIEASCKKSVCFNCSFLRFQGLVTRLTTPIFGHFYLKKYQNLFF